MLDLETGERSLCPEEIGAKMTPRDTVSKFRVSDHYVVVGSDEYEQAMFYLAGRV